MIPPDPLYVEAVLSRASDALDRIDRNSHVGSCLALDIQVTVSFIETLRDMRHDAARLHRHLRHLTALTSPATLRERGGVEPSSLP